MLFMLLIYNLSYSQTFKTTYDPSYRTETGEGFYSDFEFIVKGIENQTKASIIELTALKVNLEKGWYKKNYSTKARFYTCSQLNGLCDRTVVGGFWINIEWNYAGKVYQNGGQFTGGKRDNKFTYVNIKNYFTPPSDIPSSERGNATIKTISISSCSYSTSNEIFELVNKIK